AGSPSVSPGTTGASSTPERRPAARIRRTASSRFAGGGAPGSICRASVGSTVVMLDQMWSSTRRASAVSRSRSRRMRVPFVMIESALFHSDSMNRTRSGI
ncbi:MAG: hypothetical protein M3P16_12000, partial [Chloroflexota bacterium]|nr:hypothetical protein [Chloroflexota bacterium]